MSKVEKDGELTSAPLLNGTSITSVWRSWNSMPSSMRLLRVLEKRLFLAHCRKRDWVSETPALSSLARDGEEIRPGGARPCEDGYREMDCWRAEDGDLPEG
jgi:hypothetical protein